MKKMKIINLRKWAVGKTIVSVDDSSSNCLTFTFTDGTVLVIDNKYLADDLYGLVPYEVE